MEKILSASKATFDGEKFRLFLQEELIRRCRKNQKYSLRAFAKFLGVEASFLSKIISGKRAVTAKTFSKFSTLLGLTPYQVAEFREKDNAEEKFNGLTLDHFHLIAEWHHFAILELLSIRGFRPSKQKIAQALGLSITEAASAVERLLRLGYLEITPKGKWLNVSGNNTTTSFEKFTNSALIKAQEKILEMAIESLHHVPLEERDQSAIIMAIDSKLLPKAKEKIKAFRRKLMSELQSGQNLDQIYNLSISLYPVTQLEKDLSKELQ